MDVVLCKMSLALLAFTRKFFLNLPFWVVSKVDWNRCHDTHYPFYYVSIWCWLSRAVETYFVPRYFIKFWTETGTHGQVFHLQDRYHCMYFVGLDLCKTFPLPVHPRCASPCNLHKLLSCRHTCDDNSVCTQALKRVFRKKLEGLVWNVFQQAKTEDMRPIVPPLLVHIETCQQC